eukprot:symbB.v1.2.030467.t1/scaffold3403.1/size114713/4
MSKVASNEHCSTSKTACGVEQVQTDANVESDTEDSADTSGSSQAKPYKFNAEEIPAYPFKADFRLEIHGSAIDVMQQVCQQHPRGTKAIAVLLPGVHGGVGPCRQPGEIYDENCLYAVVAKRLHECSAPVDVYRCSWPFMRPDMNTALSSVVRVIHCALLSAKIAGSKSKRRVKVILVGHSLGGAVAVNTALYLCQHFGSDGHGCRDLESLERATVQWPSELQGFVKYLKTLPQKSAAPEPVPVTLPEPIPSPDVSALEDRLKNLELEVSALRDDFQKNLDDVAKVHKASSAAADAVSSLRTIVPVSLPRDFKDLREAVRKLEVDTVTAQDLAGRLQRRLDDEVSATRKASVSLEEKLEELSARLKETRKIDAPGQGSRQLKRQDSLLQVQDQCSQLSTRMGKLEEMVAGQGKQLMLQAWREDRWAQAFVESICQADEQRDVHQRLLEVRKEALEGLTQLASLQDGLPMTPPEQYRSVAGQDSRDPRVVRPAAQSGQSGQSQLQDRSERLLRSSPTGPRKSSPSSQPKLKWQGGTDEFNPLVGREGSMDFKELCTELDRHAIQYFLTETKQKKQKKSSKPGLCTLNGAVSAASLRSLQEKRGALDSLRRVKALLVSGDADQVVPPEASTDLHEVLSHPSVMGRAAKHLNLPGGTHDLFQHKDRLVHDVTEFICKCI